MQQSLQRVLTAFVFFVAVAVPSRETAADMIVQDQKFGLLGISSDATLNYILFNPSLGTLTGVEYVLTSQILEPLGATLLASVGATGNGLLTHVRTLPSPGTPINFNFTETMTALEFPLFIGIGQFPAEFSYFAGCSPCSGVGWSGDLTLTYTYDPVPGPIVGAGLPGLVLASGGLLAWWRRKRKAQAAA